MRVTIAPTEPSHKEPVVTLTLSYDDVSAEDAVDLVKRALVAYGFHWDAIFEADESTLSGNRT